MNNPGSMTSLLHDATHMSRTAYEQKYAIPVSKRHHAAFASALNLAANPEKAQALYMLGIVRALVNVKYNIYRKLKADSETGPPIACTGPDCDKLALQKGMDLVVASSVLMLRMAFGIPDAISINGNANLVSGFGTDLVLGENTSILKVLTGPDIGQTTSFWSTPTSVGWDLSAGVVFTSYYYFAYGNDPIRLEDFRGFSASLNAGFGMFGADISMGMIYAPLGRDGEKGFYIGVSHFYGAGDPGGSLVISWGDTEFHH